MAKSMRSKSKRKFRSIKRVRYAAKELKRLHQTLQRGQEEESKLDTDTKIMDTEDVIEGTSQVMDTDSKPKVPKVILQDKQGNFPVWLHQRKVKRITKKTRKARRAARKH